MPKTLASRCRNIDWLLLDVDGVLTDGSIVYSEPEQEIKSFHVRDGSGIKIWQRCDKGVAILSGRTSSVTALRAQELGIATVLQGSWDKLPRYQQWLQENNIPGERVCYCGDDQLDVPIFHHCGLAVTPADACPEAMRIANYVTLAKSGRGAVREAIELILRCQDRWPVSITINKQINC